MSPTHRVQLTIPGDLKQTDGTPYPAPHIQIPNVHAITHTDTHRHYHDPAGHLIASIPEDTIITSEILSSSFTPA